MASSKSIISVLKECTPAPSAEDLKAAAEKFSDNDVADLSDLGTKPDEVKAKIAAVLAQANLGADVRDRMAEKIMDAWTAEQAAPGQPAPPASTAGPGKTTPPASTAGPGKTPTPDSPVPAGAINVQDPKFPTLKAEIGSSITTFTVPAMFAPSTDKNHPYVSPTALELWQWILLSRTNNLTKAFNLTRLLGGSIAPHADRVAFYWQMPAGFFDTQVAGVADSTVTCSVEEDSVHSSYVIDGAVSGKYEFCEASVKASYRAEATQQDYSKVQYLRARQVQTRCVLHMGLCLVLAPVLSYLVGVGLDKYKNDVAAQFDYFTQLFDKFGHVVPQFVELGGVLQLAKTVVSAEHQDSSSTKASLDTSVTAKVDDSAYGTATLGYQTDGSGLSTQSNYFEHFQFTATGGNPGLVADAKVWLPTVNDPALWQAIQQSGLLPITNFLAPTARATIATIIDARKKVAWANPVVDKLLDAEGAAYDLSMDQVEPFFPQDGQFTLESWQAEVNNVNSNLNYLGAYNYAQDTPDPGAVQEGKDAQGNPITVVPGDPLRVEGAYYTNCQPVPGRVADSSGNYPDTNNLLWKILYTGRCTNAHEPYFWIVTSDMKWVLSVFKIPEYANFACLYPFDQEKKLRTTDTSAKWILRAAAPPGSLMLPNPPDNYSGYFRLYNPNANGYLADYAIIGSRRHYIVHHDATWGPGAPGAGGGTYMPPWDQTIDEAGPSIGRTMVRPNLDPVELASVFDPATGKPDPTKQSTQSTTYKTKTWLIHQWPTPTASPRVFPELEDAAIDAWIANHEAGLTPTQPPS